MAGLFRYKKIEEGKGVNAYCRATPCRRENRQ